MPKDKFIRKARLGGEEYAVSLVTFPVFAADCGYFRRSYTVQAQGEEYQWILRGEGSPKVSATAFGPYRVLKLISLDLSARQTVGSRRNSYRQISSTPSLPTTGHKGRGLEN